MRDKNGAGNFPKVEIIPHGVDRNRFYPLPELVKTGFASQGRTEAKRRVFGDFSDLNDSFVVLNASRPDKRKRIDLTFAGFAKFAAGKPANVRLCLHQAIRGDAEDQQMASFIRRYGLGERVFLNPLPKGIVDDDELNLLYNACDAGINTAMGEGWSPVNATAAPPFRE